LFILDAGLATGLVCRPRRWRAGHSAAWARGLKCWRGAQFAIAACGVFANCIANCSQQVSRACKYRSQHTVISLLLGAASFTCFTFVDLYICNFYVEASKASLEAAADL
jgi:hypothetical protein